MVSIELSVIVFMLLSKEKLFE